MEKATKEVEMYQKLRVGVIGGLVAALLLVSISAIGFARLPDRFFYITLIIPIGNVPREQAGQILARDLERIGIGVNLRFMEFAAITPRFRRAMIAQVAHAEGGYDMYMVQTSLSARIDPSGMYDRFASDQIHPAGRNRIGWQNAEFDRLIYQAVVTADDHERWAIVREAQELLHFDGYLPSIPLWRPAQFYGLRTGIMFPEYKCVYNWQTYAFRWAWREVAGKTRADMSLHERTLIYAQPADIDAFLMGFSASSYTDRAVGRMAFDSLIKMTRGSFSRGPLEERGPRPQLAKSWDISEDGKTWTIHLREDVTWHDGEPFTADDVIFTFNLLTNPYAGYGSDRFVRMHGVTWEKLDNHTVRFNMEIFSPMFAPEVLDFYIKPEHRLGHIPVEDLARSPYNTGKIVVGTGPWILVDYRPGEFLKYRANENYHGGRPWFDYVVIRIIPEASTAWFALVTGEIDIAERWYGFGQRELEQVEADPNLFAIFEPSFGPQLLRINHFHPILSCVYIRRAISLASNRQVMVDVISGGLGVVANQHLPPWSPGHNPALPPLAFDLYLAMRMMEKAGFDYATISLDGPGP